MNKWPLVPYTRGEGICLGFDEKPFPHFIGVTAEKLRLLNSGQWDFVVAAEELADVKEAWRIVKPGGHLCALNEPDWSQLKGVDYVERAEWHVFRKAMGGERVVQSWRDPKPAKTCAIVRYGAFGDIIQTSSVFPWLKSQGYHITLYTSENAFEVVKHDPYVDRFVVQGKDQVPNEDLLEFWEDLRGRYSKFVNLSESIEGTLLALPQRANHQWPHEIRHKYLNVNYLEFTHELAGVPMPARQAFYATEQEHAWARAERAKMTGPVILWSLAGSSIHKTWAGVDQIIARLMMSTTATVVLVGDELCKLGEAGWEREPRVLRRSGVWSIRQSLAFLDQCDLVIGPETGVLNAAGMMAVPKVIMLSHSSPENLTKHWVNCASLTPFHTACWPCHQLHFNSEFCPRGEATGTAVCQENISVDAVWSAVTNALRRAA